MLPLLEVIGLHKSFGPVRALAGADLLLWSGEVLALVGDNGAGKSTLIKHISGVYRADAGEIRLNGALLDLHGPADARRLGIETVYQDLALADDLSVGRQHLSRPGTGAALARHPAGDRQSQDSRSRPTPCCVASKAAFRTKARTVSRLSGGQRQAVAIARALYWQSKVVILDEPTAALAVMEREHVIELARRLAREGDRRDLHRPQPHRNPRGRRPGGGDVSRPRRPRRRRSRRRRSRN